MSSYCFCAVKKLRGQLAHLHTPRTQMMHTSRRMHPYARIFKDACIVMHRGMQRRGGGGGVCVWGVVASACFNDRVPLLCPHHNVAVVHRHVHVALHIGDVHVAGVVEAG